MEGGRKTRRTRKGSRQNKLEIRDRKMRKKIERR